METVYSSIFYAMCSLHEFLTYGLIPTHTRTVQLYYIYAIYSNCAGSQLLICMAFYTFELSLLSAAERQGPGQCQHCGHGE